MTLKKLLRAGLTALAVLAVGALLADPVLAQAPAAPGGAAQPGGRGRGTPPPPPEPVRVPGVGLFKWGVSGRSRHRAALGRSSRISPATP